MIIASGKHQIKLEVNRDFPTIFVIEEANERFDIVKELYDQCNGEDSSFSLSDKGAKELSFQKNADIVLSPFDLNCNDKKVLTKLYQDMQEIANENYFEEKTEINCKIVNLIDKIVSNEQYDISFSDTLNFTDLFKIYDVKLEVADKAFVDKLCDYIVIMKQLCNCNFFLFLNFIELIPNNSLDEFLKFLNYQEVYVLFLEYNVPGVKFKRNLYILDNDLCFIENLAIK